MRDLNCFLLLILLILAGFLEAAPITFESGPDRVSLLELYTSQGCHSCPPGEAWLDQQAETAGLWNRFVPVSFHVDYWDYLGWKDPFAKAAFSQRQRAIARQGGSGRVYTPGFFLNGNEHRGYFERKPLQPSGGRVANLTVTLDGQNLSATYGDSKGSHRLWVALLEQDQGTVVRAGENRGKHLVNNFVVRELVSFESKEGRWDAPLPFKIKGAAMAFWVTGKKAYRPLQATGGWLNGR